MNRGRGYSVLLITVLKSICFVYLTLFFVGESTLSSLLTDAQDDYELFEDLEEEDTEKEELTDENEVNVVRVANCDTHYFANVSFSRMVNSENFGSYKNFHKEIPDPPPEILQRVL